MALTTTSEKGEERRSIRCRKIEKSRKLSRFSIKYATETVLSLLHGKMKNRVWTMLEREGEKKRCKYKIARMDNIIEKKRTGWNRWKG